MIERYYLKADHEREWSNVTREQFIAAEQAAGFRSKFGPNHPATSGFSGSGMRGRIEYVTEQPRPEQMSGEASETVPCELCCTPTRMKSTKRCDRCWELEHRIQDNPALARKILAATTRDDAPAAPERGEWRKVYDGPSRPMIETSDGRLLSISQLEGGRWNSYEQEDSDIDTIVTEHNQHSTLVAQRERLIDAIRDVAIRSLLYCEQKYDHDDQARLNLEALLTAIEQEGEQR